MAQPAYLEIPEIPGSAKVASQKDMIEVLAFDYTVAIPTDPKDGTPSGTRRHGAMEVTKNFDKASPKLADFLVNGTTIPEATLHWYRTNDAGQWEEYFWHKIENARVTEMKTFMMDVDDPEKASYKHMEQVAFRFDKITWHCEEGQIEATDSWKEQE